MDFNLTRICIVFVFWAVVFGTIPVAVQAHDAFQVPMEERYGLKSVSCKTCHPNNKDRSIHNKFGKYFEEALKGKDITKKFREAEAKGEESVKEYEKEMVQHFVEAMKVVEKEKITFEDLLRTGLLNGTRPQKKPAETTEAAEKE